MQAYVQESSSTGLVKARLASIDAYRGLVIFLMLAEVLRFCLVPDTRPDSVFWRFLCDQQTHAEWTGCSLHDLIQAGFLFLVGVVLPFSIARRQSSGQTCSSIVRHAVARSLILVMLGMVLVAVHQRRWIWWFDDTLTQIGLAYTFLLLLGTVRRAIGGSHLALSCLVTGYGSHFPRCRCRILTMPWSVSLLTGCKNTG
jgi:predicted acyltransferase